jgi:hypothetical protein
MNVNWDVIEEYMQNRLKVEIVQSTEYKNLVKIVEAILKKVMGKDSLEPSVILEKIKAEGFANAKFIMAVAVKEGIIYGVGGKYKILGDVSL